MRNIFGPSSRIQLFLWNIFYPFLTLAFVSSFWLQRVSSSPHVIVRQPWHFPRRQRPGLRDSSPERSRGSSGCRTMVERWKQCRCKFIFFLLLFLISYVSKILRKSHCTKKQGLSKGQSFTTSNCFSWREKVAEQAP